MSKLPRVIAVILIVAGGVQIAAGIITYFVVQHELSQEEITVSSDADHFAGEHVDGPFTAYSQAEVIKKHADEIADGQTYAQLDQNDPRRQQVMTSSFLRASLFTSVVAFGVAVLVVGLGLLWVLLGIALLGVERQVKRLQPALAGTGGPVVAAPVATAAPAAAPVAPVAPPAAPVATAAPVTAAPAEAAPSAAPAPAAPAPAAPVEAAPVESAPPAAAPTTAPVETAPPADTAQPTDTARPVDEPPPPPSQ